MPKSWRATECPSNSALALVNIALEAIKLIVIQVAVRSTRRYCMASATWAMPVS